MKKGAVDWVATFTPESDGPYQLDVSFRTTHLKVLHANLVVASSPCRATCCGQWWGWLR